MTKLDQYKIELEEVVFPKFEDKKKARIQYQIFSNQIMSCLSWMKFLFVIAILSLVVSGLAFTLVIIRNNRVVNYVKNIEYRLMKIESKNIKAGKRIEKQECLTGSASKRSCDKLKYKHYNIFKRK